MNALIYDIEIVKGIPDKKKTMLEGIEYCAGWEDHANMGISCEVMTGWRHSEAFDVYEPIADGERWA